MRFLLLLLALPTLSVVFSLQARAQGFLEMPDVSEVPDYESESMLLDLDIPPVRDRDPDPEAGPRLNIKEFRLQGVVEFPELGITRGELIKRVEAIRFDLMKEGELLDSGYTIDEVSEVSDLLAEIEKQTQDQHVGTLEVQKLVFLIREQRRRRGVTLGMIETVADTITRYYRERGFILAKAYIPEQKVRDGVVTLTLLLGDLGQVDVANNKRVSAKMIRNIFKPDMNKPVTSWRIEEKLYLVNDIPGVDVQGFFQPGLQVGDTRLGITVRDERLLSYSTRIDNHGSDKTGEYRVYADVSVHNPLRIGDELRLSGLGTVDPDNTTYGAIRYSSFLFSPRWRGELGYSTNDFVSKNISGTDGVGSYFTGDSQLLDAKLTYIFQRSRVANHSADVSLTSAKTDLATLNDSGQQNNDVGPDVFMAAFGYNLDILNQRKRQLYLGRIAVTYADASAPPGSPGDLTALGTSYDDAAYLSLDFSALTFFTLPFTQYETRVLYNFAGQYSGKAMTNVTQMSVAGPTRVRGLAVNSVQFDDAWYLGSDWLLPLPKFEKLRFFGEEMTRVFQPYLFADYSYGKLNPISNSEKGINGTYADIGAGLKINYRNFNANLSAAHMLLDVFDEDERQQKNQTERAYFYFDMTYRW